MPWPLGCPGVGGSLAGSPGCRCFQGPQTWGHRNGLSSPMRSPLPPSLLSLPRSPLGARGGGGVAQCGPAGGLRTSTLSGPQRPSPVPRVTRRSRAPGQALTGEDLPCVLCLEGPGSLCGPAQHPHLCAHRLPRPQKLQLFAQASECETARTPSTRPTGPVSSHSPHALWGIVSERRGGRHPWTEASWHRAEALSEDRPGLDSSSIHQFSPAPCTLNL